MKLLIIYGTTDGHTRKISTFLRYTAKQRGHQEVLRESTELTPPPGGFDAFIVATSLHSGKYQSAVERYVQAYHAALNRIPCTFVSVSLTAAGNEPESWERLKQITEMFLVKTGWQPEFVEQVAGALRYSEYNFLKKLIMRLIAWKSGGDTDTSEDYEYSDWEQVKKIVVRLENVTAQEGKIPKPNM